MLPSDSQHADTCRKQSDLPEGPASGCTGDAAELLHATSRAATGTQHRSADLWTALLVRAQAGDREALAAFASVATAVLFARARAMLPNDADAWDALQETLLRVMTTRSFNPQQGNAKTYVTRMLINSVIDYRRRQSKWGVIAPASGELAEAREVDPALLAESCDNGEALHRALALLRPAMRDVIVLRYFHKKTFKEIAAILGTSLPTASGRHYRALRELRELLAQAAADHREAMRQARTIPHAA